MNICYLCGEVMISQIDYKKKGNNYSKDVKVEHKEHIIQDSLHGRLTDSTILCETCGTKLSDEIDSGFVKCFQSLTDPISSFLASKTKNRNYIRSLKGHVTLKNGETKKVDIIEGRITPLKPYFDPPKYGIVNVYSKSKTATNYVKHVKAVLEKQGHYIPNLTFNVIDDLHDYIELGINFSEGLPDFNNKFEMGYIKIAVEFAIKHGVLRTQLLDVLDIQKGEFIFSGSVFPYLPISAFDKIYDPLRLVLEPEYPTHTIILYVDDFAPTKMLVCYVELYSTFPYYVILNSDYTGEPVHATYHQTVLKQEKPVVKVRDLDLKDLMIFMEEIGVNQNEFFGKTFDEVYDLAEVKYNQKSIEYQIDLVDSIRNVSSQILRYVMFKKSPNSLQISSIDPEVVEAIPDYGPEDLMSLRNEFFRMENENPLKIYRQNYSVYDKQTGMILCSTMHTVFNFIKENPEKIIQFGHHKFNEFQSFVRNNK